MGFEDRAQALVATASKIARLQEMTFDADVLEVSKATLLKTGTNVDFDRPSEDFYSLMLEVPISVYAALGEGQSQLERRIESRIGQLIRTEPHNRITEVIISPELEDNPANDSTTGASEEEEAPSFWQPGCLRLFISHTSPNKNRAHLLKQALAEYHIAAFVAHDDIVPTRQWEAEIERALRTSDALAAIMTPDFVNSLWCDQEVGFAIGRGKLVVPLCSDTTPHGFLGKFQLFKTKGLLAPAIAEKLFGLLLEHPLTANRMADAVVDRMVTSPSFDVSRRTVVLLERLPFLTDTQVTRLVQSTESNNQVSEAIGVPYRIHRLVARVGKAK